MNAIALEQAHTRDERLRWHCRRALLELDIVFSRFWAAQGDQALNTVEAESLKRLLALEDHPLWDLVNGSKEMEMSLEDAQLLNRLRRL
jgi:antitoxin CptB